MRLFYPIVGAIVLFGCNDYHHARTVARVDPVRTPVAGNTPPAYPPMGLAGDVVPFRGADAKPPDEDRPVVVDRGGTGSIGTVNSQLEDAFYGYDRSDLTETASSALQGDAKLIAAILTELPRLKVIVEGHCDERGSAEYNLALGDNRARRASEALRELGLPAANIQTISYGKESPQCTDAGESCWQKNRRAHIVLR